MPDFLLNLYKVVEPQLAAHGLVFLGSALLFVVAKPLLNYFNRGKDVSVQIRILRVGIVAIFILHVIDIIWIWFSTPVEALETGETTPQHIFIKVGYSIGVTYATLIAFNIASYFSRKKFGTDKKVDGEVVYLDTYNSRLFDIVAYVVIFLFWVYTIIIIWGFDDQLQTTGFVGIILGFIVLTNGIWMPDVYYGMVILNSNLLDDGDVIKFNNHENEHVINRVTFVYTILLDVRNNHRLMVRNSQLVGGKVDNLTKRASIDGLRHSLLFNIGYPKVPEGGGLQTEKIQEFKNFRQKVQKVFDRAFEAVKENDEVKINRNMPFEVALVNSADYALTFSLSFYLEALPNTKVTKTIRQYLVRTPAFIQEAVNEAALEESVQLATPILVDMVSPNGRQ